jgi:hypothetical protein
MAKRKWSAVEKRMVELGPRRYTRTVLRGYVAELHRLGIFDAACARAPPEILPLLENPGRAPSWLGPEAIDEVLKAVDTLRGREAVRELGYHLVKHRGLASVLEPFVHLAHLDWWQPRILVLAIAGHGVAGQPGPRGEMGVNRTCVRDHPHPLRQAGAGSRLGGLGRDVHVCA